MSTRRPTSASATLTITENDTINDRKHSEQDDHENESVKKPKVMVLKLKGTAQQSGKQKKNSDRHIHWTEDTIDNEEMNKKKSNICCIFHPVESDECCNHDNHDNDVLPEGKNVYEYQPKYEKKE